jgi:hypothetical protein
MSGPSTDVPNAPSEHGKPAWPEMGQDADDGHGDGNDSADAESVAPGRPSAVPATPPPPD